MTNFDYSNPEPYPTLDKQFHLHARQSLTYIELMKLIQYFWHDGHPDVKIVPHSSDNIYDPDKGYIVYWLQNMFPRKDFPKPQYIERIRDTELDQDIEVAVQIFQCLCAFTVVHKKPEVAELILETFEDFMMDYTKVFKEFGAGDVFYSRRYPDNEDVRVGEDLANRTVVYMFMIQKTRKIYIERLNAVIIDARIKFDQIVQIDTDQATPNIEVVLSDTFHDLPGSPMTVHPGSIDLDAGI